MGLQTLNKAAADKGVENNIKQLIVEEVYEQLSAKFPKLIPAIVGVDVLDMINENTAVGAAVLMPSETRILIPVVYTNGLVDATTFLYQEDHDSMIALTKKTVNFIMGDTPGIHGSPVPISTKKGTDPGDIKSLFVPPQTYTPKVASGTGGLLFAVTERYPLVKVALADKLQTSRAYRAVFEENYGPEATDYILKTAYSHAEYVMNRDVTPADAAFSIEEILAKDWMEKQAAAEEFALYGFAISQGRNTPTKSLVKTASQIPALKTLLGTDTLETIPPHASGVYRVFDAVSLSPIHVLLYKTPHGHSEVISSAPISYEDKDRLRAICSSHNMPSGGIEGDVIGQESDIEKFPGILPFEYGKHRIGSIGGGFSLRGEASPHLIIVKDKKIIFGTMLTKASLSAGLGNTAINTPSGTKIVVQRNSSQPFKKIGNIVYAGDLNVFIVEDSPAPIGLENGAILLNTSNIDLHEGDNTVHLTCDAGHFYYKGMGHTLREIVMRLLGDGFDKFSVYRLTKTAATQGEATMTAVDAKIDMLSGMIMNLAGKVESLSSAMQAQGMQQGAPAMQQGAPAMQQGDPSMQQGDPSMQQGTPNMQQGDPGVQQGDPNMQQGAPAIQQGDPQASADMAYAANQSTFDNGGVYGQQGGQMPEQQPQGLAQAEAQQPVPGDVPPQQPDTSGMNQSVDPEILRTLADLKDSKVMDIGVIATLGIDAEMSEIVASYRDDILHGVSAIGRILFNMMVRRAELSKQIGDAKYNKIVSAMRNIFVKLTNVYVDIASMGLEADAQVDH